MDIKAFIFDLDGVIVSTDECHYLAWKKLSEAYNIPYSREINMQQRGVSRMESLEVMLKQSSRHFSPEEKQRMAEEKNGYYLTYIANITPNDKLKGVDDFLSDLKKAKIKTAIGSSSKNTKTILKYIEMLDSFDAIIDGTNIKNSKPDPEVFLLAAKELNVPPQHCVVIEDADAGIEAALSAGMRVIGIGAASTNSKATISAMSLDRISVAEVLTTLSAQGKDEQI